MANILYESDLAPCLDGIAMPIKVSGRTQTLQGWDESEQGGLTNRH